MAFTSYAFLIFFFVVFALYWVFPKTRWQNFLLLSASLVFYGWLAAWHVWVLVASIVVDYFLALGMVRWKSRATAFMWLGILLNLALLLSVKYYAHYDELLGIWARQLGYQGDTYIGLILLPLGTSFYTLKKIGYLVDVQRGTLQPVKDFFHSALMSLSFRKCFQVPLTAHRHFSNRLKLHVFGRQVTFTMPGN